MRLGGCKWMNVSPPKIKKGGWGVGVGKMREDKWKRLFLILKSQDESG